MDLPIAGASYGSPRRISGAEYARDPQLVSSFFPGKNLFEKPSMEEGEVIISV